MWDMPDNTASIALIEAFARRGKPIVAVCHAPIALVNVRGKDCDYLIRGKRVTGFSNDEEDAVGCAEIVPYLLEDRLKERGAIYTKTDNWAPYVQVDDRLITGQNPASAGLAAEALLKLLQSLYLNCMYWPCEGYGGRQGRGALPISGRGEYGEKDE